MDIKVDMMIITSPITDATKRSGDCQKLLERDGQVERDAQNSAKKKEQKKFRP